MSTTTCWTCGVNKPSYDSESLGHFSNCHACFELNHTLAPHRHDHTAHQTRAVFYGGILVARQCTKPDCGEHFPVEFRTEVGAMEYLTIRPTTAETMDSLARL